MAFERMSFFLGAISSYPLQSFLVSLEKNETKKGFPLLSGLGFSGIKKFEKQLYFISIGIKNTTLVLNCFK
jgi:hypothetical protein